MRGLCITEGDHEETTAEPAKPRKEDRRQVKRKRPPEVSEGQRSEGHVLSDKTLWTCEKILPLFSKGRKLLRWPGSGKKNLKEITREIVRWGRSG